MAEDFLKRCLSGDIKTQDLFDWILHKKYSNVFNNSSPGEFISFFLNFIHESAIRSNIDPNTSQKIQHLTPKSIYPPCNDGTKPRRRSALFSNQSKLTNPSENSHDVFAGSTYVNSIDKSPVNTGKPITKQAQTEFCPISPLHNASTPIRWRNQTVKQTTPVQNKGLCLADFMSNTGVEKKSSAKKRGQKTYYECNQNRPHKRINPVFHTNAGNSNSNGNSFNFQNIDKTAEISISPVKSDPNLTPTSSPSDNINVTTPIKCIKPSRNVEIDPNLSLTTFIEYLDNSCSIYLFLLKHNLTLNILSEFSFLTTLLLTRRYSSDCLPENHNQKIFNLNNIKDIFGSIHNVVYFASKVLREFIDFFVVFDRATIKVLLDNNRVTTFVEIPEELEILYNAKHPVPQPTSSTSHISLSHLATHPTVHFAAETDSRPNFSSCAAFNAFRCQRDAFYDILRKWKHHHSDNVPVDDTNMCGARGLNMAARVKQLLGMNVEGDKDYRHLARLWRGQMLVDCCGSGGAQLFDQQSIPNSSSHTSDTQLITALPHLHPDKLNLLCSRLTTRQSPSMPQPTTGSGPLATNIVGTFPGIQEFYRDFIVIADDNAWCCHLRDALVCELMRLYEETVKICSEYQEKLTEHQSERRPNAAIAIEGCGSFMVERLLTLKLLAKFLGLLESIPYYKSNISHLNQYPESRNLSAMEINEVHALRKHYRPSLDVLEYLEQALIEEKLILTIPWMVEYCAMLDTSFTMVIYFENVFKMLFQIYYQFKQDFKNNSKNLIILCLGWLFELPQFPSELFYKWYNNLTTGLVNTDMISHKIDNKKDMAQPFLSIDRVNIIDERILYFICPHVGEYKLLFLPSHSCKNNITVKHITPVSTIQEKSPEVKERKLKAQLEEAFFNAQPASVLKIVDFVSERIASTCVKIICNNIVPTYRKSSIVSFKNFLAEKQFDETNAEQFKSDVEAKSKEFQTRSLRYLQILCVSEAKQIIQERVHVTAELLLSEEELPLTKVTCGEIAARISYEKVQQWISTHVNTGVLSKEFHVEIGKYINKHSGVLPTATEFKLTFQLPPEGRRATHNVETLNAVSLVEKIRSRILIALENPSMITTDSIDKIIEDASDTLTQRCDVNDCILFLINKLFLDLLITLVAHKSDFVTTILMEKFFAFWSNYCAIEAPILNGTKETLNLSKYQMNISSIPLFDNINSFSSMECQNSELDLNTTNKGPIQSNEQTGINILKRLFNVIICPRNIVILSYGLNNNSFRVFAMLILELLKRDLISCKDIEEQIVSLYKYNWNESNLQFISIFVIELVYGCKNFKIDDRFALLFNFLSSFCAIDFE